MFFDIFTTMKKILRKAVSTVTYAPPLLSFIESTYRLLSRSFFLRRHMNQTINWFIPATVKLGKYDFHLNNQDAIVSGSIAFGVYEHFATELFCRSLKPDSIVMDIGANIGLYIRSINRLHH